MARHTTMELCSVFVRVQWVCFFSLFLCRLLQHLFWFRWNFICCGPLNSWFIGLQTGVLSLSLSHSLIALATSNTLHSIQNFICLPKLQALVYDIFPWRKVPESDARSVLSALTLHANQTITIRTHRNIWWKSFLALAHLFWGSIPQHSPPLWFVFLFQNRSQDSPVH